MKKYFLSFSIFCLMLSACNNSKSKTEFFDKAGMDTSIKPDDNFFGYANGSWIKNAKIPDDQSGWVVFIPYMMRT